MRCGLVIACVAVVSLVSAFDQNDSFEPPPTSDPLRRHCLPHPQFVDPRVTNEASRRRQPVSADLLNDPKPLRKGLRNRFLIVTGHPDSFKPNSKARSHSYFAAASTMAYSAMHSDTDVEVLNSLSFKNAKGQQWWRVSAILARLPFYEWILYVDSDTVISNYTVSLAEFAEAIPHPETFLIVRVVRIKLISADLNNGVFLIRNTALAYKFLEEFRDMAHPSRTEYNDQTDFITLLNKENCLWPRQQYARGDYYYNYTWFQDREGLVLQHYGGKCNDCCKTPGERGFIVHFPGYCGLKEPFAARPRKYLFKPLFRLRSLDDRIKRVDMETEEARTDVPSVATMVPPLNDAVRRRVPEWKPVVDWDDER
jgi:hypothetical protein